MTSTSFPQKGGSDRTLIFMFRDSANGNHRFLSNFWPCAVTLPAEGDLPAMDFPSLETAYMAWKTTDLATRLKIQSMRPADAKELSHQADFPLRADYCDQGRIDIVRHLLMEKFGDKNPNLRDQLLSTGDATLVEGNTWGDTFFGFDLLTGKGHNHLGRLLMEVRAVLQGRNKTPDADPIHDKRRGKDPQP